MMNSKKDDKEQLTEATIETMQDQEEINNKQNYNEQLTKVIESYMQDNNLTYQ